MSINDIKTDQLIEGEKKLPIAHQKCTEIIPEHYSTSPSSYNLLKCWIYMLTVAFPNVYSKHAPIPSQSKVNIIDDYGTNVTKLLNWSADNFKSNKDCVLKRKPKHVVHHTGYFGANVPTFQVETTLDGVQPMISDIGFKTANMFKDSNELFHKLEETFDAESMIKNAEQIEQPGHERQQLHNRFQTKDSLNKTDLDKEKVYIKHQSAIESMRLQMEIEKEVVVKKKLNSLQSVEYILILIVLALLIALGWMYRSKTQQAEKGRRYEDSFMNNF